MSEVKITYFYNPFTFERQEFTTPITGCLEDTVDASPLRFPYPVDCVILLNGVVLDKELWKDTPLKDGDHIAIRTLPHGGDRGKVVLRTVAMIALTAATWGVPALAWAGVGAELFGLTGWAAVGVNTAVQAAGMWLIDKVAPLPTAATTRAREKEPKSYGIESSKNAIKQWGTVPVLLGRMRFHPPYAAEPYTEVVGNDQFVNMLFCIGYYPMRLEDLAIGELDLDDLSQDSKTDDEAEDDPTNRDIEWYIHENFNPSTDSLRLFKNDIHEEDLSIELKQTDGYTTRTTEASTDEVIVDITAPNGIYGLDDEGNKTAASVDFEIQFSLNNSTWTTGVSGKTISQSIITIAQPSPYREYVYGKTTTGYWITSQTVTCTRIGIDKSTGEIWQATTRGYAFSQRNARKWCPNFPGYVAPICLVYRYSDVSSIRSEDITDLRSGELNSSSSSDFAPSVYSSSSVRIAGGTLYLAPSISGQDSSMIRRSYRFKMPSSGTWYVRVRRITLDHDPITDKVYDTIYWTALRSVNSSRQAVTFPQTDGKGLTLIELRVKASERFNGTLDDFTVTACSVCYDYDESSETWISRPTNNPAALFRHVLTGQFNKRPVETTSIHLDDLALWSEFCNLQGFTFNAYIDYQTSVFQMLQYICAAGRGSPTYKDGKYSVVWDDYKDTIVQHFTPRNSWNFRSTKAFYTPPHAFRVTIADEYQDFNTDEVFVYADGYNSTNATVFEELSLPGITNYPAAWKLGRFHLAQLLLRPEKFTITTDVENLVCTRGDLVRVTHDIPLWGLNAGRIKSFTTSSGNITTITLDETVTMESGKSYGIRIRTSSGSSVTANVATSAGETNTLTLSSTLSTSSGVAEGDLIMFGERSEESVECLVNAIRPSNDLTAEIELVDYSPAIYTADTGTIPDYDTHITAQVSDIAPQILSIRSDEPVMKKSGNAWIARILVTFKPISSSRIKDISYIETTYKVANSTSNWLKLPRISRDTKNIYIDHVEDGVTYWIKARYIYKDGHAGPWSTTYTHQVVGKSGVPSNAYFDHTNTQFLTNRIKFVILPISDFDLDFYEIRTDTNFGSTTNLIVQTRSLTYYWMHPHATGTTYYIKARDTSGNYSAQYDSITPTTDGLAVGTISVDFTTINCVLTWNAVDARIVDYYYVLVYKSDSYASGDLIYTSHQFTDPHFEFTYELNCNCSGGPYRELWFRVYVHDIYGRTGYADAYGINTAPPKITTLTVVEALGGLVLICDPLYDDIIGYDFACDTDNPPTSHTETGVNFLSVFGLTPDITYYCRVRAKDPFGYGEWSDVSSGEPQTITLDERDMDIPITSGANWNASSGNLTWSAHTLIYKGNTYNIPAGNAGNNIFAYWDVAQGNNGYNNANSMPLTGELWMMCYRSGNNAYPAFQSRIIHGGLIQVNTLYGNRIISNSLALSKINGASGSLNISAGGTITLSGGNLVISSGNFTVSATNGINITSGGGITVQAGGGISIAGNATTPGVIRIYKSGLSGNRVDFYSNATAFGIIPSNNNVEDFALGNSTYRFRDLTLMSGRNITIRAGSSADAITLLGDTIISGDLSINGNLSATPLRLLAPHGDLTGYKALYYSGTGGIANIANMGNQSPRYVKVARVAATGSVTYAYEAFGQLMDANRNMYTVFHGAGNHYAKYNYFDIYTVSGNDYIRAKNNDSTSPNVSGGTYVGYVLY